MDIAAVWGSVGPFVGVVAGGLITVLYQNHSAKNAQKMSRRQKWTSEVNQYAVDSLLASEEVMRVPSEWEKAHVQISSVAMAGHRAQLAEMAPLRDAISDLTAACFDVCESYKTSSDPQNRTAASVSLGKAQRKVVLEARLLVRSGPPSQYVPGAPRPD